VIGYLEDVRPAAATGQVAEIYGQIQRDFGSVPDPFRLHCASPRLLGGVWGICRETLVAGRAPRHLTELVATVVSQRNACPYCVDAHTTMLRADGHAEIARQLLHGVSAVDGRDSNDDDDDAWEGLAVWAAATATAGDTALADPPFQEALTPELVGTAVAFHYINRMVTVLAPESPFPGPRALRPLTSRVAPRLFRRAVERSKQAGEALRFSEPAELPGDMSWAQGSPSIAAAFAGFMSAVKDEAHDALSPDARGVVEAHIGAWNGADQGLGRAWVEDPAGELPESDDSAAVRLALLTALAPHQVDRQILSAYRQRHPSDRQVLALLSWSSAQAARRIGTWSAPRRQPAGRRV
jgi:AhpD family alkylhydroperoxidase